MGSSVRSTVVGRTPRVPPCHAWYDAAEGYDAAGGYDTAEEPVGSSLQSHYREAEYNQGDYH
jgi:hypothetical protein